MAEIDAKKICVAPLRREYRPRRDAYALLQSNVMQTWGLDTSRKLDPQHVAALGTRNSTTVRKMALPGFVEGIARETVTRLYDDAAEQVSRTTAMHVGEIPSQSHN